LKSPSSYLFKFNTRCSDRQAFCEIFHKLFQGFHKIRKIVMPANNPAWPSEIPSQPQASPKKATAEIATDNPPQIQVDSPSNSAARRNKTA
jgi:hypothetical protein